MEDSIKTDYDSPYHRLFSQPAMVQDLIERFLPPEIAAQLIANDLRRVNAKLHAEALEQRDGDVVYRVGLRSGGAAWLLLMLEFQSRPDRWMALRVLTYAGLLWQQWIAQEKPARGAPLPPVFPVVLYNGAEPWGAASCVSALLDLPSGHPVAPWQPEAMYYLIDEARISGDALDARDGLCALLIRLEQCTTPDALRSLVELLIERLADDHHAELRRSFVAFLLEVIRKRGLQPPPDQIHELVEVKTMLEQTVQRWFDEVGEQGLQQGLQQGELQTLERLCCKRIGRPLVEVERQRLAVRVEAMGVDATMDFLLEACAEQLEQALAAE